MSASGAGAVDPTVPTGQLPGPGVSSSPLLPIQVYLGGKPASVLSQTLSPGDVGVVDLRVTVPNLVTGRHFLALTSAGSLAYGIPVFVLKD